MIDIDKYPKAKEADIALLLEGSYPFVKGGVSSWVQQLIKGLPEYKFAIMFLGTSPQDYAEPKYELPANVVHFQMNFLFPRIGDFSIKVESKGIKDKGFIHDWLSGSIEKKYLEENKDLDFFLQLSQEFLERLTTRKKDAWDYLVDNYIKYCTTPSFLDYYWNIIGLQKPLWNLASGLDDFPKVKVVHSISTGYAGFFGSLVNGYYKYPLVLTEHGIYTLERRIELWQKKIAQFGLSLEFFASEKNYLQELWVRFFSLLAKICYEASDPILSLFYGAQKLQIVDGASDTKTKVVPNGINIGDFAKLREQMAEKSPPIIGFVGRVVPIKDVKLLIRAMAVVKKHIPDAKLWVVGNNDEDPAYAEECKKLTIINEVVNQVEFKGWRDVHEIYPQIGVLAISSISEGMPLTVLECFAAGVPVVATDVGACRELIFGADEEDKAIGMAGDIVQIGDSQGLAHAVIKLLQDPDVWKKAQQAAITRVEKYYDQETMFHNYRNIYQQAMERK